MAIKTQIVIKMQEGITVTGVDAGSQGMLFRLSMMWRSRKHRRLCNRQPFADSTATAHLWPTCRTSDPTQIHPRPKYAHTNIHVSITEQQMVIFLDAVL